MRKIKAFLLLTFLMTFVALQPLAAQTKEIVVNTKNQTLPKAFKLLEKATPYRVMYETKEVSGYKAERDVRALRLARSVHDTPHDGHTGDCLIA